MRGSAPGERRGGRQKGTPNKTTVAVKEAFASVYADLQAKTAEEAGEDLEHGHFAAWAKDNPTEFYKLYSKLLPLDLNATINKHEDLLDALR